jgi:Flp pilus assembly protein TadD
MPRRSTRPPSLRRPVAVSGWARGRRWRAGLIAGLLLGLLALGIVFFTHESPERLRSRAERATQAGDWSAALSAWRAVNRTRLARARTYLAEARACLALDRAAQAERALRLATAADPADPEPWRLLLELLRVEDRVSEAQTLGWSAYKAVTPSERRPVLRDLTLALLADLPEDLVRATLARWAAADPNDLDARAAQFQRIAASPRSDDPDRNSRIATLTGWLARNPAHLGVREALVTALADAGEPDVGRHVLDGWPAGAARDDPRYVRLLARWDLDYNRQPERAVAAFERVLRERPQDWKTHYRVARAFRILGREADARRAAETVSRLREILDPSTLGPRLASDLEQDAGPRSLLDLADLCAQAGLTRLAQAWRIEAATRTAEEPANANVELLTPHRPTTAAPARSRGSAEN